MDNIRVILEDKKGNWLKVGIIKSDGECIYNSAVQYGDVGSLLEDLGLDKKRKSVEVLISQGSELFIELKNKGYKVKEVTV